MPLRHRLSRCALALLLACAAPAMADAVAEVQTLLAAGNLAGALERAERALADKPGDAKARFVHGVVLMDLQRDEEALAVFTLLTQEYPELPDPYNNVALLQARAGRPDLALQALQNALRSDPGHRTARANLGRVHLMLAVQAWEQAAAAGPLEAHTQRLLDGVRALLASGLPTAAPR
ncbi:MAG TPA: tetratricopeptide repeat protein [Rubrivivax sp.]|nr:tetratricopeptide repeat protein [Rubrivivax sp.]